MKIGIFDSGLGGLLMAKAIKEKLPKYDYVYLGDTKRTPYGGRSAKTVYQFTKEGVNYLFKKENCALVILACNTASALALNKLQKEYSTYDTNVIGNTNLTKDKKFLKSFGLKILGVLVPTAEETYLAKRVGVLATTATVNSKCFSEEIKKIDQKIKVYENPAPLLVPLVENGEQSLALPFLKKYLGKFDQKQIDTLILGCTHYPFFKKEIRKILGTKIKVISQDELIPRKLKDYLDKHLEIKEKLGQSGSIKILVTDSTESVRGLVKKWFVKEKNITPVVVDL